VLLTGGAAAAQTVAPPIAEFRGFKAEGTFTISNNTEQSMMVTLEARSFTVQDGNKVAYRPLSPTLHLEYGSSSFVLPANDSHTVYYKAVWTVSPVSFSILPTMTPISKVKGIRINFCIPHMVYVYQKAKLSKGDVQVAMRNGKVVIANSSEKLGRVQYIQDGNRDISGFPLYPGQTREVVVSANKATIQFEEGFKVEAR
jgi:hypothetical protein